MTRNGDYVGDDRAAAVEKLQVVPVLERVREAVCATVYVAFDSVFALRHGTMAASRAEVASETTR